MGRWNTLGGLSVSCKRSEYQAHLLLIRHGQARPAMQRRPRMCAARKRPRRSATTSSSLGAPTTSAQALHHSMRWPVLACTPALPVVGQGCITCSRVRLQPNPPTPDISGVGGREDQSGLQPLDDTFVLDSKAVAWQVRPPPPRTGHG